jgi:hypothetical protein
MEDSVAASTFGNLDTTEKLARHLTEAGMFIPICDRYSYFSQAGACENSLDEYTVAIFGE